ncbi:MAG: LysR substrate-binding domain-containing protein [Flavobacteriaceae bacterium]
MTITQLHYLIAVAEHQNFTVAAEKSFVTQPTLSMQIAKLEEELNVKLFDRGTKPIKLTAVGEKIVEQAKSVVIEAERIKDIVSVEKGFIGGPYNLGIIPTVMPTLLPMFLATFIKKYPKVKLIIKEMTTEEIAVHLREGKLDGAIAATPLGFDDILERPLYYEPFVAYIPEDHRLNAQTNLKGEDLRLDEVLLLEDGHCFRDGVINLCGAPKQLDPSEFRIESGSFETLIKLSDENMGMTLLPYLHTLQLKEVQEKRLKHFEKPEPAREISLIYHKSELKLQITTALKEVISSVIRGAISFHDVEIISPKQRSRQV